MLSCKAIITHSELLTVIIKALCLTCFVVVLGSCDLGQSLLINKLDAFPRVAGCRWSVSLMTSCLPRFYLPLNSEKIILGLHLGGSYALQKLLFIGLRLNHYHERKLIKLVFFCKGVYIAKKWGFFRCGWEYLRLVVDVSTYIQEDKKCNNLPYRFVRCSFIMEGLR